MDYTIHGVTKSQTQLSDFHFQYNHIYIVVLKFISILLKAKLIVLIYPMIFTKNIPSFFKKKIILVLLCQNIPPTKCLEFSCHLMGFSSMSDFFKRRPSDSCLDNIDSATQIP